MAGCIGDDEFALVGREEAIGDVDGDALLALGGEAIDEKGEIDIVALRADLLAVALQSGELVFEDLLGIVEQAPDQRALAVIDAAAGDEPQKLFALLRRQIAVDILGDEIFGRNGGHQK